MTRIAIVDWRADWVTEFETIAARVGEALRGLAIAIDHIGSTAVPGLPAKDVVDVQARVRSLDDRSAIVARLTRIGLVHAADVEGDHVPAGISARPRDWSKLLFHAGNTENSGRRINLHVRADGSANASYALLFRDYLRADARARDAYAAVKRALARKAPDDWDFYYDVKDPVCDVLVAAAEQWASSTRWSV